MKGTSHLTLSLFICFIFITIVIYSKINILNFLPLHILIIAILLFLLGSILPDADSNNKGSLIYVLVPISQRKRKYKKSDLNADILLIIGIIVYPIAFITNQLENILRIYTKRPKNHRQSLHTISGIIFISLFWTIIFYLIYISITKTEFNITTPLIWAISLFLGQFLHLLEDLTFNWRIKWK